jgi:hypothetical protein
MLGVDVTGPVAGRACRPYTKPATRLFRGFEPDVHPEQPGGLTLAQADAAAPGVAAAGVEGSRTARRAMSLPISQAP